MTTPENIIKKLLGKELLMTLFWISATFLGISVTLLAIVKASLSFNAGLEIDIAFKKFELSYLHSGRNVSEVSELLDKFYNLSKTNFNKTIYTLVKLSSASTGFLISFIIHSILLIISSSVEPSQLTKSPNLSLILVALFWFSLGIMVFSCIHLILALREIGMSVF